MSETEGRIWRSARSRVDIVNGRRDWYRIDAKANAADVYIYDEIGYFGTTANEFVRDLQGITANTINLHLNSPGGDVFDGIAIFNALKSHKAAVTTYIDGLAASAASFIAMAGDSVVMMPHARMMIHDAWGLALGNAEDMRKMADRLDASSNNIASIYAERTGGDTEFWRGKMRDETWYTDQEAVDAGLADSVGSADASSNSMPAREWDLSVFRRAPGSEANHATEVVPEVAIAIPQPTETPGDEPTNPIEARRIAVDRILAGIGDPNG